jgi:hypothetical protein
MRPWHYQFNILSPIHPFSIMKRTNFILLAAIIWLGCSAQITFAQTWTKLDGAAHDIAVGADGTVWVIGTTAKTGGYGIFKRVNNAWQEMPGAGVRIAVDPQGNPWVVNSSDDIYKYGNGAWTLVPGKAKDIAIGADGSVFIVSNTPFAGNYTILRYSNNAWEQRLGAATRISVDPMGEIWTINSSNQIKNNLSSIPGSGKDISVGANGDVWVVGMDGQLFKWNAAIKNWEPNYSGGNKTVAVGKSGEVWAIQENGDIYNNVSTGGSNAKLTFLRKQFWEPKICQVLGLPDSYVTNYNSQTPFQQIIGSLALDATEVYFATKEQKPTPEAAIQSIKNDATVKNSVLGLLAIAVMDKLKKGGTDAQYIALKDWSTATYRRMRIDMAKNTLAEYKKWYDSPCTYQAEGYTKPHYCNQSLSGYFSTTPSVPTEILGKQGLKATMGDNDAIVAGVSTGLSAVALAAASTALASSLGTAVWTSSMAPGVMACTSLYSAFGGSVVTNAATGATTAGIGASGWGGVVAGPAAIIAIGAVFISMEIVNIVEFEMAEPRLKKELGKAMSETIQIANVLSTDEGTSLFYLAFVKAAKDYWPTPVFNDKGEVTFFCQAGFVSKFNLSYKLNGQTISKDTKNLGVGQVDTIAIPAGATNIVAKGYMISAGDHLLFTQNIAAPTYTCYKTYGTIVSPQWAIDWPLKEPAQLKLFHQGGYVGKFQIDYERNGQTTTIETGDQTAGWTNTYTIPEDAKNIRLRAWGCTGLAWEWWRLTLDHTFPDPPNECVKIYGTTLDQQWAADCE